MNFEEAQKIIEEMLAVQKKLIERQLLSLQERELTLPEEQLTLEDQQQPNNSQTIQEILRVQGDIKEKHLKMLDNLSVLMELSKSNQETFEQLKVCKLKSKRDRSDLLERVIKLEERVKHIEQQQS